MTANYRIEVSEQIGGIWCVVKEEPIEDPFVVSRTTPGGKGFWGRVVVAWAVLRGRYKVEVNVRGAHDGVYRAVMGLRIPSPGPREPHTTIDASTNYTVAPH